MPFEVRRIVFSNDELTQAVREYGAEKDMSFPSGKITRVKKAGRSEYDFHTMKNAADKIQEDYNVKNTESAVIVTFFDENTLEHKYYNLTNTFLASSVITYCINQKIPLPQDSEKTLDLTDFNVCMDIHSGKSPDDFTTGDLTLEDE